MTTELHQQELLGELDHNAESAEWMFAPIFADAATLIRSLLAELEQAEARLVKADNLAEALRYIVGDDTAGMDAHLQPVEVATKALATWESA